MTDKAILDGESAFSKLPLIAGILQKLLGTIISTISFVITIFVRCCRWQQSIRDVFSLTIIEHYRQGPQQHNDWNFLLWRLTFPIFGLIVCLTFVFLGQIGGFIYTLIACPSWYMCNLVLIGYPYFLLYQFQVLNSEFRTKLWKAFGFISFMISFVEWFFSNDVDKSYWIIGNTMFGIVGLIAIPMFFFYQKRCRRETTDQALIDRKDISLNTFQKYSQKFIEKGVYRRDYQNIYETENAGIYSPPSSQIQNNDFPETNVSSTNTTNPSVSWTQLKDNWIQFSTPHQPTYILYGIGATFLALWVTTWIVYLSPMYHHSSTSHYWCWSIVFIPFIFIIILLDSRRYKFSYNFSYLILYTNFMIHAPDFLGHFCLLVFSMVESETNEHVPAWAFVVKFAISIAFLITMQGYFYMLTRVVQMMSEPFSHPSLLYIGQLYFYMFWYMLVSNDTPIDGLYIAMLLVNNIHIVFSNTGLYSDLRQWHIFQGLNSPLSMCMVSSIFCYRRLEFSPLANSYISRKARQSDMSEDTEIDSMIISEDNKSQKSISIRLDTNNESREKSTSGCCSRYNLSTERNSERETDQLRSLYFLMKMAEQDNMADTSALILVPTLLTAITMFDTGFTSIFDKFNLWLRCIFMFLARIGGSYLAREVFAYKLKSRLKSQTNSKEQLMNENGISSVQSNRLFIQSIMLQDFQKQFWYLSVVTIVCTFVCFEHFEGPIRYAFLHHFKSTK